MKKLLLLLLFISPFFSDGQTNVYHPFPEDSAKWCASICGCQGYCFQEATYQLSGKILINGYWYSRMLYYENYCNGAGSCLCGAILGTDTATYYIRQDTAQKKVWLYVDSLNIDTIFLDFDLQVGDTIDGSKAYWAGYYSFEGIVSSIDSVLIGTQYRTRYKYENQTFPNYLIEGIGPDHGFFYDANIGYDHMQTVEMFLQNNIAYYPWYNPTPVDMNNYCHDFSTGNKELNQNSFLISPNPAHNSFTITSPLQNARVEIYNVIGERVYQTTLNSKHQTLNTNLSTGLYFVKLQHGEQVNVEKLIIE
jgi:hypothetical protein